MVRELDHLTKIKLKHGQSRAAARDLDVILKRKRTAVENDDRWRARCERSRVSLYRFHSNKKGRTFLWRLIDPPELGFDRKPLHEGR